MAETKAPRRTDTHVKFELFGSARKGAKQYQEDSFFYFQSTNKLVVVTAVFDGHGGYNGLIASTTARDTTHEYFEQNALLCESWTIDTWKQNVTTLFSTCHENIRQKFANDQAQSSAGRYVDEKGIIRSASGDPIHGGSTGSLAVLVAREDGSVDVVCANVGDSTAIMFPRDSSESKRSYQFLTVDHGPENPDEFKRLMALPADQYPTKLMYVYDKANVFRKYECPRVFLEDGRKDPLFVQNPWGNGLHPTNVRYEPAVYAVTPRCISKDTTCIAMTRALGDFYATQFGLSSEPSVQQFQIPAGEDYSIIVASDGIWDCWKYEDLASHCNNKLTQLQNKCDATVEHVLSDSIQRAVTNFGAKHFDDASLIMVRVLPPTGGSDMDVEQTA